MAKIMSDILKFCLFDCELMDEYYINDAIISIVIKLCELI